ncbi:hypothetical protein BIW11_05111 [Tropilaelaps mercedesae]|uniref:Uncharacterized protein n=1 Tax=Tropilaelaps mercedesae TaxID=418985 RepID=A0A1V9Y3L8_9ACAR|nr:hypothetical protein BIW11_05111 [Tropilaelaps mercedesae]
MWLGLSLFSLITDAERWLRKYFLERAIKRAKRVSKDGESTTKKDIENILAGGKDSRRELTAPDKNQSSTGVSETSKNFYSMTTSYGPVMIHQDYRTDSRRFPARISRRF